MIGRWLRQARTDKQTGAETGPIAVGGVGGSGTRLVADWLRRLGVFIGEDCNEALDNLWVTLLYKRRDMLLATADERALARDLLYRRMGGAWRGASDAERAYLESLATTRGGQQDAAWLQARVESFCAPAGRALHWPRWGWKEPNTHIFSDWFLAEDPGFRYIHLYRNGLETAFGRNRNQTLVWGPVFFNDEGPASHARTLAFWCAAHRRMTRIAATYPKRVLMVRFEDVLAAPEAEFGRIAAFAGLEPSAEALTQMRGQLEDRPSRIKADRGRATLDPADLAYLESLGFDTRLAE